ncbi:MAG: PaRep2b protein [Pyrobaculum sp.]
MTWGVGAEVKKEGGRDIWYVMAHTDMLAAGRGELRKALAEVIREALARGWVDASKAEGWMEKLEEGRVLMEGWPKYLVRLTSSGALEVGFASISPDSIEREAQRLRDMGLEEGKHYTVKMPEGGGRGYVSILREGLAYAAWLSVNGSGRQRDLAAAFVEYILQRAKEAGKEVYEKAREIVKEGKARGSLTLKGFVREVEVEGRRHVVKVIDGGAVEEGRGGRKLLRIKITAEVDGVRREYTITYGRYGDKNETKASPWRGPTSPAAGRQTPRGSPQW